MHYEFLLLIKVEIEQLEGLIVAFRCTYGTRQGGEYQKRFRQSVSAQVVACLAVVTLIKDCQQNLEITQ